MRAVVLFALFLPACATVPQGAPEMSANDGVAALPAQTLGPGNCGLFGYSTETPSRFVFFASSNGRALYQSAPDETRTLRADDAFPASTYGPLTLDLGEAEDLIDGLRYSGARLVETLPDGFERVRPLVVLQSCGPA